MNGRPVTDAQISKALRAHLPEHAQPGLRARVLDATRTTSQQRPLPSFLGALSDADPVNLRRNLLIAAALLVALALASAMAVGAWRLIQQDPIDELSLDPPADVPAFVLSSYERLPQLPPVALTWRGSDSTKGRIYVDRSGAVRFDQFASADTTEPSAYRVLSGNRISGVATVGSEAVWVDDDGAIENPRDWIRGVLGGQDGPPGCEMERDPSDVGSETVAAGWRYIGTEYVAGRPTHHVACAGDLWIDIETRLILRTQGPAVDDAGQPIPVESTEVTEIAFGEQPAALFEPPEGLARWSAGDYKAYICARDLPNELVPGISDCPSTAEAEATPAPEPSPTPMPTEGPDTSDCAVPPGDPSQPIGPLAWTPERLKQDWPAPVRLERARGGSVQPMPLTYLDPTGDNGSTAFPCVDIRGVLADTSEVHLKLVSNQPPVVDPAELWIAYGVVIDDDRDGVPDWRYGTDNMPADASADLPNRGWRTNLHTGQTDAGPEHSEKVRSAYGAGTALGRGPDAGYPNGSDASFTFGGAFDTTQGSVPWGIELDMPFYTWASVIVNGRVVATDYAPDVGWLIATPGAEPEDAPDTPASTPGDTPRSAPGITQGGTYMLDDPFPIRLSMNVADGWTIIGDPRFYHAGGLTRDEGEAGIRIVMVDNVDTEYCADRARAVDGRATVDDLVAFLAGLPPIDISVNRDVTLDGYRGKYLEFTRKAAEIDCGWGGWDGWPASSPSARDEDDQLWILDVNGAPLVIDAFSSPEASETVKTELRQIVESIQIEP